MVRMVSIEACIMSDTEGDLIEFEIAGEPIAQRRPRVAYACRQMYNPQSAIIKKLRLKLKESLQMIGHHGPYPFFGAGKK